MHYFVSKLPFVDKIHLDKCQLDSLDNQGNHLVAPQHLMIASSSKQTSFVRPLAVEVAASAMVATHFLWSPKVPSPVTIHCHTFVEGPEAILSLDRSVPYYSYCFFCNNNSSNTVSIRLEDTLL